MTDCTAKVTTADITDDVVATVDHPPFSYEGGSFHGHQIPDGATVQRQGDRLVRVYLYELPCERPQTHPPAMCHQNPEVDWWDTTPGAVLHEDDATVSEAEVDAAMSVVLGRSVDQNAMRAALLAAKRAEKEQA